MIFLSNGMFKFVSYINFLLNVYLQRVSCSFYIDFQIGFKFDYYNHDKYVLLQC